MQNNSTINTEQIETCYICGKRGHLLYSEVHDYRTHTGSWNFMKCFRCKLMWLNPRPIETEFSKIYTDDYITHSKEENIFNIPNVKERIKLSIIAATLRNSQLVESRSYLLIGRLLTLLPHLKEIGKIGVMYLDGVTTGKLLDVGCGGGKFLATMKKCGWEVYGVEPDTTVARRAHQLYAIPIAQDITEFAENSFDAVTMSHVIEHVYEPYYLINMCYKVLRPGGRLIITTPNIESLGHLIFRQSWSLLDPPRHVHLFSMEALRSCVEKEGFQIDLCRTTAWYSRGTLIDSYMTRFRKRLDAKTLPLRLGGFSYQIILELFRRVWKKAGEEIILIATKGYQ